MMTKENLRSIAGTGLKLKFLLLMWGAGIVVCSAGLAFSVLASLYLVLSGLVLTSPITLAVTLLSVGIFGVGLAAAGSLFHVGLCILDEARHPILVLDPANEALLDEIGDEFYPEPDSMDDVSDHDLAMECNPEYAVRYEGRDAKDVWDDEWSDLLEGVEADEEEGTPE